MKSLYKYIAPEQIMNDCMQFAKDSAPKNDAYYSTNRDQHDNEIKKIQRYYGKIGEWCAYEYFIKLGISCTEPDMEVKEVKDITFNPDLYIPEFGVHVKTHDVDSPFPISWVFQEDTDPLVTKPKENDLIAVTIHGVGKYPVETDFIKLFKGTDVVEYYDEMVKKNLNTKRALYWYGRSDGKNKKINELENILIR